MSDLFISREQAESDVLAAAAFIGERINSADGLAESMSAVVPRYLNRGDVDLAAELANLVDDPFSRGKLLTLIAAKCAETDDDEYASQLADAIEDVGLRFEAFERIGIIKALNGQTDLAGKAAEQVPHPDLIEAAGAIYLAEHGNEADAVAAIDKIEFPSARVHAFQQLAAKSINDGDSENAVSMLERSNTSASEIEHAEERIRALCDSGNLFVAAKRFDLAVETFAGARDEAARVENMHRDYFLGTCALGFLNAGSRDMAEKALDLVTDKTHMAAALLGFAREDWRLENRDDAIGTLDEAFAILDSQREIETRDSRSRNALWTSIATQFAGFGKTERGIEIASLNIDDAERTNGLIQIAHILTVQNEDELAMNTAEMITDPADRAACLTTIAAARTERGDSAAANTVLDEAERSARSLQQLPARADSLLSVADGHLALGQDEKAKYLVDLTLDCVREIKDASRQASILAEISDRFSSSSDLMDSSKEMLGRLVSASEL